MVNTKGGSKHKKYKKVRNNDPVKVNIRDIVKSEDQEYAYIVKILGNCRFEVECFDKKRRLAHMRGKLRKRAWCVTGDIVLIGLRTFQDDKCDILHKYSSDEIELLIHTNNITESFAKEGQSMTKDASNDQGQQEISFISGFDSDSDDNNQEDVYINDTVPAFMRPNSDDDSSLDIDNI